jgi:two-component system cell cycle sensor histidine kinase/response regulator CckA
VSFGLEDLTVGLRARLSGDLHRLAAHRIGGPALAFLSALVGFAAVARFSYHMVDVSGLEALWLPNGVLVALFVLVPRRCRVWVLLGMLPGELISDTLQGYPAHIALGFGLTDMLESALAGLILLKIAGRRPRGDRQRDFYAILSAAAVAPIVGGLVGAAITTAHWGVPYQTAFLLWWFGDLTGIFLMVSFAISIARPPRATTRLRWLSALVEVSVVIAVTGAVFGLTNRPIMFLVLFPVVGIALRHSLRVTSFASLAFAIAATWLTGTGHGPFVPLDDAPLRVMLAQGFITLTAAIAFLISATMASQRRAERELAQSLTLAEAASAQVRASFDGAAIGMMLIGVNGAVLAANLSGAAMFGRRPSELVGTDAIDLIHPDDRPLLLAHRGPWLAATTGHAELELRNLRKDGTVTIGRYTVSPILAADGSMLHRLAEIEDVTELRRLEAELTQSRAEQVERDEQLRQAQKLETVGRLAGGVAHDFNNLLVGILGYNELALEKINGGPGATEITGALAAAKDAAALTAQLLAHSRRQVLDPQVFDLRDTVTEITDLLRRMIDGRVEIVASLPEHEVLIKADRPQIGQVIMNLAVNASDAMPSGGRLTIEAGVDIARHRAVLTVTDEGVGMDAETAAQIYEPFFTTKGDLGTGLGLSTVHGIVVQSGGQIDVESTPGQGTTFTITLPLGEGALAGAPAAPAQVQQARGGEQILFVDDEPTVRDVVSSMLTGRGYRVSVAADGAEAVAFSQSTAPGTLDIVVTDLAMTGLNGRQTAAAIRVHQPDAKTLYVSGYTEDEAIRAGGYEAGVGFLQKPFSTDELDAKIRTLLDAVIVR